MKNFKTAAILGIATAAGYGIYKALKNERVQATVYTVAGNVASAASETGSHIANGVKSVVNKEVSGEQAVKTTAKNIKQSVINNYEDCKCTLGTIRDIYSMEDAEDDIEVEATEPDIDADTAVDEVVVDEGDTFDDIEEQVEEEMIIEMMDDAEIEVKESDDIAEIGTDVEEVDANIDIEDINDEDDVSIECIEEMADEIAEELGDDLDADDIDAKDDTVDEIAEELGIDEEEK